MVRGTDLTVSNYTQLELEDMFGLSPGYTPADVEQLEAHHRVATIQNANLRPDERSELVQFYKAVKNRLINTLQQQAAAKAHQQLIPHTPSLVMPVQQTQTMAGTLDPLHRRTRRQNMNIDSRFRDNWYTSSASDYHINLPFRLQGVVSMELVALELPHTFYNISRTFGNTSFVIERESMRYLIEIADGNYTYVTLLEQLNSRIADHSALSDLKVYVDLQGQTGTGRTYISSGTSTPFALDFGSSVTAEQTYEPAGYGGGNSQVPLQSRMGWLLGFRLPSYGATIEEQKSVYSSESLLNVNAAVPYLYLAVDDFNHSQSDTYIAAFQQSFISSDIIARIAVSGSVMGYQNETGLNLTSSRREYYGAVNIQTLQVRMLDAVGRPLNLNGMDYSFVLSFELLHDSTAGGMPPPYNTGGPSLSTYNPNI